MTTVGAFLFGLVGSVHCFAMCGGVVGALCAACPSAPRERWALYNVGRLASYVAIGAVGGALGSNLVRTEEVRIGLRVVAILCMLAAGLQLAGFSALTNRIESVGAPIWRAFAPVVRRMMAGRTPLHALGLGAAWGFMPCGLLYGALSLAASSGSASSGAATMLAFGVATLPAILVMTVFARGMSRHGAVVKKAAGVLLLSLGAYGAASLILQFESPLVCCVH